MLMVQLKSSDNEVFEVSRDVLCLSGTFDKMLKDLGLDSKEADPSLVEPIPLPNVNSATLRKVLEWCQYHQRDSPTASNVDYRTEEIAQWDADFIRVELDELFKIIEAANYLEVRELLELGCKVVADMIRGKNPEEIRSMFQIVNDFTPEEEQKIREENEWFDQ